MDSNDERQIELRMGSPAMSTTACKIEFESITMTNKEQYCDKTE
jgi:hypothetical protein